MSEKIYQTIPLPVPREIADVMRHNVEKHFGVEVVISDTSPTSNLVYLQTEITTLGGYGGRDMPDRMIHYIYGALDLWRIPDED